MADDDSLFEKALARQLRESGAEHGEGASWEQTEGMPEGCLDAEVLAAYHERTLGGAEMILCKEHVASCGRCQEILALLESTEEVAFSSEGAERDAVPHERESFPPFLRRPRVRTEALGSAKAHPVTEISQGQAVPASAPVLREAALAATAGKRAGRSMAYWLAPLGAIAAGLLVWVGMQTQTHKKDASMMARVERAEDRAASQSSARASAGQASLGRPSAAPAAAQRVEPPPVAQSAPALRVGAPAQGADEKLTAPQPSAPKPAGTVWAGAPVVRGGTARGAVAARSSPARTSPRAMDKADAGAAHPAIPAAAQSVEVSGQAPGVEAKAAASGGNLSTSEQASLPLNGRSFSQLTSGMEPQNNQQQGGRQETAPKQGASAPPPPAPAPATTSPAADATIAQNQAAAASTALMTLQAGNVDAKRKAAPRNALTRVNTSLIPAPGGNVVWRVGDAGRIEQSRDAGDTWSQQMSGVTTTLEGGSAVSDAVCWVVGRGGTILVTVDGGGHWTKVASPVNGELGGVQAADARNATVWDAKHKTTFVTNDGGVTWKRAANE